ncbi:glycosyltransferase family A protein [Bradyrhizobium prioriisuperbiae]|uniref:glycosyltransferase family 2 protein n=1 Tax=Bradyrhizobium prioriisuperbiae TaxID=2854389 RepID=UPI0028E3EC01|nr:glycosyltransferase family A protein [Bradyrhizobium prioritasuperba]
MSAGKTNVSVVMPALNGERYIALAIESGLSQLTDDDELIVVDNASTDSTARIVKAIPDPRIKYHYEPRSGAAVARNRAFRHMQGTFVAFLDCDDLWPDGRQQGLMHCLDENPAIDAAYGRIRLTDEGGLDPRFTQLDGVLTPFLSLSSFLFRRIILEKAGEMDETLLAGEDTDYLIRLQEIGMRALTWDGDASIYRRHETSTTVMRQTVNTDLLKVLSRKIHRNRIEKK